MFYHQKVAGVRVFADIQNFALRARHSFLFLPRGLLDGGNYHREGPQIHPKFAPRAPRGKSARLGRTEPPQIRQH